MAEKRMFAKTIIDSDAFLEMPATSQLLYFHLSMRADDEGFVNKPKAIMRTVKCGDDDLLVLSAKGFIIPFESGVVVIKHWKIHNLIRQERINATKYTDERQRLVIKENGTYTLAQDALSDTCQTDVGQMSEQIRLDKVRLDKTSVDSADKPRKTRKPFTPPTLDEVKAYISEHHYNVDAKKFYDYFTVSGWVDKKGDPVLNWKQKIITWSGRDQKGGKSERTEEDYTTSTTGYGVL